MRQGEKVILTCIIVAVLATAGYKLYADSNQQDADKGIPFHSAASAELARDAMVIYQKNDCKDCHTLWATRDMLQSVPAPALDGIGSLHDEAWFYRYFSAENPQEILPSRLKKQYRMPSFARLSDEERHTLARYMASLKVDDWYLAETRKAEYEKLTGKDYRP